MSRDGWLSDRYSAEYTGGFLFITDRSSGADHIVRIINGRGQCVTRGQFRSSIKSHGFDRACETFCRLSAKFETPSTGGKNAH